MSKLKLTTLATQDDSASVPADTIVNGTAKAWVNFNGIGAVAIRRAFNVSSITDNGTGNYAVNFTNALVDADYAAVGMNGSWVQQSTSKTASSVGISSFNSTNGASQDTDELDVAIFS
jgi:hypothetical protein